MIKLHCLEKTNSNLSQFETNFKKTCPNFQTFYHNFANSLLKCRASSQNSDVCFVRIAIGDELSHGTTSPASFAKAILRRI